jgi:hypothetical protein
MHCKDWSQTRGVFGGSRGVEELGACLIDAIGVDLIQHLDQAGSAGAITNAACLFPAVKHLNIACPHKVKHCVILVNGGKFPEATLIGVLIKLEVFRVLPVLLVRLLKEMSPREPHDSSYILSNIAGENNVVAAGAMQSRATVEEINTFVKLVMGKLQEVVLGHDRHASVGDIRGDFRVGEDKGTIHGSRIRE